ncbi:oxidoreductase [Lactobacillus selangorensis]|uniref:Oxidoreductase n=1 Tax=Lactobacillus selangorensis TaxID=81857 RepID=A0A0R2G6S1_9LACO|nr:zinc-binding dehydrogenase [Lactobacillus selangorensis]KRN29561.1 oxidoreductase [Lactobacillus selangorensis]KRN33909.1 oxidoreductase [Lactobacillus selangorensis]
MQALVVKTPQSKTIAQLVWQEVAVPTPGPDELQIAVKAVGLNPVDYKVIAAGNSDWTFPHTVGLDAAGVVSAIGSNVTDFRIGDRVAGHANLAKNGVFAEKTVLTAAAVAHIPDNLSFETAAASLCAGLTAYQDLFRKANLSPAVDTVLIQGGAGGVGSMAIQLAHQAGKTVLTTVSPAKRAFASRLRPEALIDYRHEDVMARVRELTHGRGVDVIVNTAGDADAFLAQLAYNGQLVRIQNTPTQPLGPERALSYSKVDLGGAHRSGDPHAVADLGRMTSELLAMVATGAVDPLIREVLTPDQIQRGLTQIRDRQTLGKLVARF